jgi:hypothetical protein
MAVATLIYHDKGYFPDGGVIEMTIWRLPAANDERPHGLKYSLFYGKGSRRIVGYDNERGKGDHRHLGDSEERYRFSTIDRMMLDFIADVRRARGEA